MIPMLGNGIGRAEREREKQTETQRHTKRERHRAMRRRYLDLIFQTVMGGEIIWKDKG